MAFPTMAGGKEIIRFGQNTKVIYDKILDNTPRMFREKARANMDNAIAEVCNDMMVTEEDMYEVAKRTTPRMFLHKSVSIIDEHRTT